MANRVFIKRRFGCSATELFRWLVEPDRIAQWFGPRELEVVGVVAQPTVGGRYAVELRRVRGDSFTIEGEFIEVDAPRSLALSLRYTGLPSPPPDSVVRMKVEEPASGQAVLSLTQEFEVPPGDMAGRTAAWEHMFDVLADSTSQA